MGLYLIKLNYKNPFDYILIVSVVVALFIYFILNNFQLPTPFFGSKVKTTGTVFNASFVNASRAGHKYQNVGYVYEVEGEWYTGYEYVGKITGAFSIGDQISISYDSWSFDNSEIAEDAQGAGYVEIDEYYSRSETGYQKLIVSSSLIVLGTYSARRELTRKEVGLVMSQNDSLIAFEWLDADLIGWDDYKFVYSESPLDTFRIMKNGYLNSRSDKHYK